MWCTSPGRAATRETCRECLWERLLPIARSDSARRSFSPRGIWNTQPGPFYPTYLDDLASPCTEGHQPANPNQSGVVFFPGSAPLYRNGQLVCGLGVSGDGVEQDDYVTAGGARGFEAPAAIRADQVVLRGVRLPYWLFPRNPEQ
jgi:hypothetical protein